MQTTAGHQQTGGPRQRRRMSPEMIGVVVNGWPNASATNVAQSCHKRGFHIIPFGLSMDNSSGTHLDVPEVGKIDLCKFSDSKAKTQLKKAIDDARKQEKFIVVVDTAPKAVDHVSIYNELQVPFILQSHGGESHTKAVQETETAKTMALITESLNKRWSAFDSMWNEWSKRYPGLFDEFDVSFRSSEPEWTPPSLLNSMSDLVNREFGMEDVEKLTPGDTKQLGFTEGHVSREYTFRNGSGSSSFSFRQSVNDEKEFAESAADSVAFLAQKSQEITRPQVYNILDVAQQNRLLTW